MYKSIHEKFITDELNSIADRLLPSSKPSSGSYGAEEDEEWPYRGLGQENEAAEEVGSKYGLKIKSAATAEH